MRPAFVLALLLVAIPATAAPPEFRYEADDCAYAYALVPAVAAKLRAEVPVRFAITGEAAGVGVAVVTVVSCDVRLNGAPAEPIVISDVGVLVDPPTGNPGALDFYWIWQVSDHEPIASLNAAWGVPSDLAEFSMTGSGVPFASIESRAVTSAFGDYGVDAVYAGGREGLPGVANWWRELPGGDLLRFEQVFLPTPVEVEGAGVIRSVEGTRLRAMLGEDAPAQTTISYSDLLGRAYVTVS